MIESILEQGILRIRKYKIAQGTKKNGEIYRYKKYMPNANIVGYATRQSNRRYFLFESNIALEEIPWNSEIEIMYAENLHGNFYFFASPENPIQLRVLNKEHLGAITPDPCFESFVVRSANGSQKTCKTLQAAIVYLKKQAHVKAVSKTVFHV